MNEYFEEIYNFDYRVDIPVIPVYVAKIGNPKGLKISALLDTGSNLSGITGELIKRLDLRPARPGRMIHGQSTETSRSIIYNVNIFITKDIPFPNTEVMGVSDEAGKAGGWQMILGMDILSTGDLLFENLSGKTKITFRILNSE